MKPQTVFSRPLEMGSIGEGGIVEHIEATLDERAAIAADHGLIAVDSLGAELEVRRGGGGLIIVDGRIRAQVVHTCVVSLEPAPQTIDEPVHVTLAPADSKEAPPPPKPGAEVMVDPASDQPEVFAGPSIDLGRIALEHFTLALDPYPRAPGAMLPAPAADAPQSAAASPFAALAGLKARKS